MSILYWTIVVAMAGVAALSVIGPLRSSSARPSRAAIALAVVLPVGGVALYMALGSPMADLSGQETPVKNNREQSGSTPKMVDSVSNMLPGLELRLENEPDDASGWLLLAKSYHHVHRNEDAQVAYEKALALGKSDRGLEQLLSSTLDAGKASSYTAAGPSIRGKVSLAADLAGALAPEASVFIIAKAVQGSQMPLAVVRKPVSELPFEFVLDDTLAMVAGMSISSAQTIEVTAKVSSTGNAMQPDEGMEAGSGAITVADPGYVELMITRTK